MLVGCLSLFEGPLLQLSLAQLGIAARLALLNLLAGLEGSPSLCLFLLRQNSKSILLLFPSLGLSFSLRLLELSGAQLEQPLLVQLASAGVNDGDVVEATGQDVIIRITEG